MTVVGISGGMANIDAIVGVGKLRAIIAEKGKYPPVSLVIKSLKKSTLKVDPKATISERLFTQVGSDAIAIDDFQSYNFSSSILVPVDSFSFTWNSPNSAPLPDTIEEGDIVQVQADGNTICTGIVDSTDVEIDEGSGEKCNIQGRDFMAQLEDQDAVTIENQKIYLRSTGVRSAVLKLIENTRIQDIDTTSAPTRADLLFGTEPGESKLAALQRFLEAINCVAFMDPTGTMVVGRPDMSQEALGILFVSREKRRSNVQSIKVTRSSSRIPNRIASVFTQQEGTQGQLPSNQIFQNKARKPNELYKLGHIVHRAVTISIPTGSDASTGDSVNKMNPESGNFYQDHAAREFARGNIDELRVQVAVHGHYDDEARPFAPDTCWHIFSDRGKVDEKMYCYQVDYSYNLEQGQQTNLYFCRLGSIVANTQAST